MKKNYRINETMMTEQEFKNFVFGTGKVASVKDGADFVSAVKNGEYIIGVGYQPFCLQKVYRYAEGRLDVFCFEEGEHSEPLNIQLEFSDYIDFELVDFYKYLMRSYDDILINPTKDMLNLDNVQKDIDYNSDEYCAYGTPADKRNCETCSMTHYFHDCNGNPIHSRDDE